MDADRLLSQITIPTPCTMDWSLMEGDERVRSCAHCHQSVYNLSAMTSEEAVDLIRSQGGVLCGRIYQRSDGSVVMADCQQESHVKRPKQFHLRAIIALIALVATLLGFFRLVADEMQLAESAPTPIAPGSTYTMGSLCVPRSAMETTTADDY
jgi:hypothetical protein